MILVVLVLFFDAGAAAEEVVLAGGFEADHIEDLSEVISFFGAGEVIDSWG